MAVKGQIIKKEIQAKILELFPGSFLYNDGKEIRICGIEEGAEVQVKVTLTAAKTNVSPDGEAIFATPPAESASTETAQPTATISAAEEDNIKRMAELLSNL